MHYPRRHWQSIWILLLLIHLLSISVGWAEDSTESSPSNTTASLPTYTNEQLLTQMLLVDASERTLDAVPALALTFSQDLQPTANFSSFITVTEAGKAVEGSWVLANEARRLYFTNVKPQTEYRIQVRPGVESKHDLALQKPADITVKTRDIQPAFDFATKGSILPAKLTSGLPIRVVNVPELDIEFLRVQPAKLPEVLKSIGVVGNRLGQWQLEEIHAVTESVYSSRYKTDAPANARTTMVIPVELIKELQQPGLYFAVMRQPGRFSDDAYRITQFVVTNIGLHVRLYPRTLEVFANALDTGKPLANVKLTLQAEKESLDLETNDQGQASFAHRPKGDLLLMATQEGQFTFLDLREPALDLSEYPVTGREDQPIAPFIYSTRDLYRPGEAVDLSILLRDRDGKPVSINNLNLRIVRPDTKWLLEQTLSAAKADLGYFAYRLPIPGDAPTGSWKAEVRLDAKDETPIASFNFHVEDFVPERMKLDLKTATKLLTNGEKLMLAVQGDYLYGAPASGNKFTASRTVSVDQKAVASLKDFYFGAPADAKLVGREDLPELTLNEKGSATLEIPALAGKINSPLTLSIIGNLYETGGRTVTRKLDVPYWPTQNLVGIHPLFAKDTVDTNSNAEFELARVNRDGQPMPPKQELAVTLVREEKEYFWEYNNAEGWQRKDVSSEFPIVQQKLKLDTQAKGKISFPVEFGYYRLEVEDADTGLKTVYPFHAGWDWERADNTAARPDQIALALDKPAYQGGDVAKLTITPPSAGEAIVSVEGDGILWSQRISLPAEGQTLDIPVDKTWNRHDLYVAVTSFRPASSQQKIAPNRALGIIPLPLDRAAQKLSLAIDAPEKVLPEQKISVTVSADNLKNDTAIVTLAAVDNGVLSITDFKTPDPFAFYFAQHSYGVNLYDAYGKIIEGVEGKTLQQRFGGDGFSQRGGAYARPDLKIVSLFSGPVEFDSQGKAKIDLTLPGFDGSLRLMAVAASSERFGSTEREMKVASPVVASIAGPRFLATGDKSFITLDLNNTTLETLPVHVKVNADPILDLAPFEKDFTLNQGKREAVRLPIGSRQVFGVGTVRLELTGKGFSAHRQLQLSVRPAYPAKHMSLNRELLNGAGVMLDKGLLTGFLPGASTVNLTLSPTPALPLRSILDGLLQYPYGCAEQTTSAAWPYLYMDATTTERLGLKPLDMKERNDKVQAAILRLAGMQLSNGSFTLWNDYGEEEFWLTPYITDFLLDAQEQGFVVPDWLLQRAIKNLQERLQEADRYIDSRYGFADSPEHLDLAARAYAAYVLSRTKQQVALGTLRTLYDQDASKAASGLPLIHLAIALKAQGDNSTRWKQAVEKGLNLVRDKDQYFGDYGSQLRDQAAMLYLLLKNKLEIPKQADRINQLANLVRQQAWYSTQEQLFTVLAGLKVQEKLRGSWKATMKVGTNSLDLSGSGLQNRVLNVDDLQKGIQITSGTRDPLYVALNVDGYPATLPAPRKDPIEVQRTWYNLKGQKVQPETIKAGDLLLTHLLVTSKETINDALVADLVPAGFEVENTNLNNDETFDTLQLEGMDKPIAELLSNTTLRYQEYRDDRYVAALRLEAKARNHLFYMIRVVSPGTFSVPPALVEDMYRPELTGISVAPTSLTINNR